MGRRRQRLGNHMLHKAMLDRCAQYDLLRK